MQKPSPETSQLNTKKLLFTLLGFALSGIALYVVFRGSFNIDAILEHFTRIRMVPLILSVVFYWGGVAVIRAYLIRHLLRSVGEVRPPVAFRYICIGFLVNNVLPLRMGEGARIGGIAKRSNISVASTAGGLVVERLMDLTMAALIGFIAIQIAPIPDNVRFVILGAGGVLLGILAVLGTVARKGLKETNSQRYGKFLRFIWNIIARFSAGFGGLKSPKDVIITFVLAALLWSVAVGTVLLRLAAFDMEPDLATALVLMAGISLGISVPSAPSGVGVIHWLSAQALIIMGVNEPLALSFAFFNHFVDFVSSSGLGAACMIIEGYKFSDLKLATAKSTTA
jgi:glycosyltransferase 2 family protein